MGERKVYDVATRDAIRDWVLVHGHSQRSAAQQFGVARKTVAALLAEDPAPTERRTVRRDDRHGYR